MFNLDQGWRTILHVFNAVIGVPTNNLIRREVGVPNLRTKYTGTTSKENILNEIQRKVGALSFRKNYGIFNTLLLASYESIYLSIYLCKGNFESDFELPD